MKEIILSFLAENADFNKAILVGVSGGPDSMVLLQSLMECQKILPIKLGIAHVDHRWRKESRDEAEQLAAFATMCEIPFHLKVLNPAEVKGNIEDYCRQERLLFFKNLCETKHYQAVALAHHADDLAETVLKRALEGARFHRFTGMRAVTVFEGLPIWRPLLSVPKKEILRLTSQLAFKPFEDPTNYEERFLRGRFRSTIIPYLSGLFGKNIGEPLRRLSFEAIELQSYLTERTNVIVDEIKRLPAGLVLNMSGFLLRHRVEIKYAIECFCKMAEFPLSNDMLELIVKLLIAKKANKCFKSGGKTLHIDRGFLLAPKGLFKKESWKIKTRRVRFEGQVPKTGWEWAWQGSLDIYLPMGEYTAQGAELNHPFPRTSPLNKLWTDAKVPAFLRGQVPVIWKENKIVHEFLSGKAFIELNIGEEALHLSLSISQEDIEDE